MRKVIVLSALLSAACSMPVDDARERFTRLSDDGATHAEVCAAGRDMLRLQAEGARGKRYPEDRAIVDVACLSRDVFGGDMPANFSDPAYSTAADDVSGNVHP